MFKFPAVNVLPRSSSKTERWSGCTSHFIGLAEYKIKVQLLRAQIIMIISQLLTTVMAKHIKIIVLAVHIIIVGDSFNNSVRKKI